MRIFVALTGIVLFWSCKEASIPVANPIPGPTSNPEIRQLRSALNKAEEEIYQLRNTHAGRMTHLVFFDLKEDISDQELFAFHKEIKGLSKIDVVKNLEIGSYKDLKDKRAMADYELVMSMDFKYPKDYNIYQNHPIHLALKENCKVYLARPPMTYDFDLK